MNALQTEIPSLKLNDGNYIPLISYGTGTAWYKSDDDGKIDRKLVDSIKTAISLGYYHLDGAEIYNTEREVGIAMKESKVSREKFYVTTKVFNPMDDIPAAFKASLEKLGLDYVDLFLIHAPFKTKTDQDLQTAWAAMEKIHASGKAKSIGVSNYYPQHIAATLQTAKVIPAINQTEFHPYLQHPELIGLQKKHGIATAAYGPLSAITKAKPGPVDGYMTSLAEKYGVSEGEISLRWCVDQGIVAITTSKKEDRLRDYLRATTFKLTPKEPSSNYHSTYNARNTLDILRYHTRGHVYDDLYDEPSSPYDDDDDEGTIDSRSGSLGRPHRKHSGHRGPRNPRHLNFPPSRRGGRRAEVDCWIGNGGEEEKEEERYGPMSSRGAESSHFGHRHDGGGPGRWSQGGSRGGRPGPRLRIPGSFNASDKEDGPGEDDDEDESFSEPRHGPHGGRQVDRSGQDISRTRDRRQGRERISVPTSLQLNGLLRTKKDASDHPLPPTHHAETDSVLTLNQTLGATLVARLHHVEVDDVRLRLHHPHSTAPLQEEKLRIQMAILKEQRNRLAAEDSHAESQEGQDCLEAEIIAESRRLAEVDLHAREREHLDQGEEENRFIEESRRLAYEREEENEHEFEFLGKSRNTAEASSRMDEDFEARMERRIIRESAAGAAAAAQAQAQAQMSPEEEEVALAAALAASLGDGARAVAPEDGIDNPPSPYTPADEISLPESETMSDSSSATKFE
ncbi:MAG: hypothetical protein M1827_002077 [Pycnora praestabilis]|nr:MAG: hypothetical protein M1827_002077 [Pycnora praestabilis]